MIDTMQTNETAPTNSETDLKAPTVQPLTPLRINTANACRLLDVSLSGLKTLMKLNDFPKPYKIGNAQQAPLFFDFDELKQWHKKQLERA